MAYKLASYLPAGNRMRRHATWFCALTLAATLAGQDVVPDQPSDTGWRKFGEAAGQEPAPPPELVLPGGSWISIRVNEPLSSDRSQAGDAFTATLAQPLVANGRVIARRGQTVAGVVVEAKKAGHVKGTSRLGLELTELSLVDGRQIQVSTKLMERRGDTSVGRDVGAAGAATAAGAAIGAAADGGFGAGMGAIAGAAASAIGILSTRGRATVVDPETLLTFRLEEPITIQADASAEAFQLVRQEDYEQKRLQRPAPQPPPFYGYYPPVYYPTIYIHGGRHHRGWGWGW